MNSGEVFQEKCTRSLLDWVNGAGYGDQRELIIRLKDRAGLERLRRQPVQYNDSIREDEAQRAYRLMENLTAFIQQLQDEGMSIKLLDTSWLTHSVLVTVTPPIVSMLAKRDEVDLMDLNSEIKGIASPRG